MAWFRSTAQARKTKVMPPLGARRFASNFRKPFGTECPVYDRTKPALPNLANWSLWVRSFWNILRVRLVEAVGVVPMRILRERSAYRILSKVKDKDRRTLLFMAQKMAEMGR